MLCSNAGCSIDAEVIHTFTESILTFFERHLATNALCEFETTSKTSKQDSKNHATKEWESNCDFLKHCRSREKKSII